MKKYSQDTPEELQNVLNDLVRKLTSLSGLYQNDVEKQKDLKQSLNNLIKTRYKDYNFSHFFRAIEKGCLEDYGEYSYIAPKIINKWFRIYFLNVYKRENNANNVNNAELQKRDYEIYRNDILKNGTKEEKQKLLDAEKRAKERLERIKSNSPNKDRSYRPMSVKEIQEKLKQTQGNE